jgi:hypothetical protein
MRYTVSQAENGGLRRVGLLNPSLAPCSWTADAARVMVPCGPLGRQRSTD